MKRALPRQQRRSAGHYEPAAASIIQASVDLEESTKLRTMLEKYRGILANDAASKRDEAANWGGLICQRRPDLDTFVSLDRDSDHGRNQPRTRRAAAATALEPQPARQAVAAIQTNAKGRLWLKLGASRQSAPKERTTRRGVPLRLAPAMWETRVTIIPRRGLPVTNTSAKSFGISARRFDFDPVGRSAMVSLACHTSTMALATGMPSKSRTTPRMNSTSPLSVPSIETSAAFRQRCVRDVERAFDSPRGTMFDAGRLVLGVHAQIQKMFETETRC
jgi:hypothetical protein